MIPLLSWSFYCNKMWFMSIIICLNLAIYCNSLWYKLYMYSKAELLWIYFGVNGRFWETILSSLGRAKNYRYQQYFVPSTIIIVWFGTRTTIFVLHQWKALDESFPTVSWLMFGSEIRPQTSYSPIMTLLLLAASVFAVSSTKIYSAISWPHPVLKPYLQLVHDLNSLLVWFQCRVWSADGAVVTT